MATRRDAHEVLVAVREHSDIRGQGARDLGKLNNTVHGRVVVEVDETFDAHGRRRYNNQSRTTQVASFKARPPISRIGLTGDNLLRFHS